MWPRCVQKKLPLFLFFPPARSDYLYFTYSPQKTSAHSLSRLAEGLCEACSQTAGERADRLLLWNASSEYILYMHFVGCQEVPRVERPTPCPLSPGCSLRGALRDSLRAALRGSACAALRGSARLWPLHVKEHSLRSSRGYG